MRAFVALEISSPEVLKSILSFQRELSATGADLKTVERENIHFTVKFLGEIAQDYAREVDSRLKTLRLGRAEVELKGVGAFPNAGRPNVVWVGVKPGHEERVRPIAQAVIAALEGIGEQDRWPFAAHVTLARVRSQRGSDGLVSLLRSNSERSFGEVKLVELKLKSSILGPHGPTYSDVGVYPLA